MAEESGCVESNSTVGGNATPCCAYQRSDKLVASKLEEAGVDIGVAHTEQAMAARELDLGHSWA